MNARNISLIDAGKLNAKTAIGLGIGVGGLVGGTFKWAATGVAQVKPTNFFTKFVVDARDLHFNQQYRKYENVALDYGDIVSKHFNDLLTTAKSEVGSTNKNEQSVEDVINDIGDEKVREAVKKAFNEAKAEEESAKANWNK